MLVKRLSLVSSMAWGQERVSHADEADSQHLGHIYTCICVKFSRSGCKNLLSFWGVRLGVLCGGELYCSVYSLLNHWHLTFKHS